MTGSLSAAVRARSVVAAAVSARLATAAGQVDLLGGHVTLDDGDVMVFVSPRGAVAGGLTSSPEVEARLLLVDLAPVAVRVRERARLRLIGRLRRADGVDAGHAWSVLSGEDEGPDEALALRFIPDAVLLDEGVRTTQVELDAFRTAEPDPVLPYEASFLHHLAQAHAGSIAVLARAAGEPDVGPGVTVVPLRLTTTGLTLRICDAAGHRDVTLPFAEPVADPRHADRAVAHLVHASQAGVRFG